MRNYRWIDQYIHGKIIISLLTLLGLEVLLLLKLYLFIVWIPSIECKDFCHLFLWVNVLTSVVGAGGGCRASCWTFAWHRTWRLQSLSSNKDVSFVGALALSNTFEPELIPLYQSTCLNMLYLPVTFVLRKELVSAMLSFTKYQMFESVQKLLQIQRSSLPGQTGAMFCLATWFFPMVLITVFFFF